jgi:hypothetical protein
MALVGERLRLHLRDRPAPAAVGFHDQAHLTRHFRRHVGEAPARFEASGYGDEK